MLGIGINVHQRATDFPSDLSATSLAMAGHDVDRLALFARLTMELDRLERNSEREGAMGEWRSRSTLIGNGVVVRLDGRAAFGGTATAIDDEGALVVRTASGIERVVTGDVRLA